eukprot:3852346-Rhodomonas_salina.1
MRIRVLSERTSYAKCGAELRYRATRGAVLSERMLLRELRPDPTHSAALPLRPPLSPSALRCRSAPPAASVYASVYGCSAAIYA